MGGGGLTVHDFSLALQGEGQSIGDGGNNETLYRHRRYTSVVKFEVNWAGWK